jgi:hypothetical protein
MVGYCHHNSASLARGNHAGLASLRVFDDVVKGLPNGLSDGLDHWARQILRNGVVAVMYL